eukprot:03843_5
MLLLLRPLRCSTTLRLFCVSSNRFSIANLPLKIACSSERYSIGRLRNRKWTSTSCVSLASTIAVFTVLQASSLDGGRNPSSSIFLAMSAISKAITVMSSNGEAVKTANFSSRPCCSLQMSGISCPESMNFRLGCAIITP